MGSGPSHAAAEAAARAAASTGGNEQGKHTGQPGHSTLLVPGPDAPPGVLFTKELKAMVATSMRTSATELLRGVPSTCLQWGGGGGGGPGRAQLAGHAADRQRGSRSAVRP